MNKLSTFKEDRRGLGGIVLVAVIAIVLVTVGLGAMYISYSMDKYPGCVFATGANEGNVGGLVQSTLEVTRHYDYNAHLNHLAIVMPGKFDQITPSEMVNYRTSFGDYVGGLFHTGELINSANVGQYSISVQSGGQTVYSSSGALNFVDHGVSQGGDVSDIKATVSLPTLFLAHGVYVISINAVLGSESMSSTINWNC